MFLAETGNASRVAYLVGERVGSGLDIKVELSTRYPGVMLSKWYDIYVSREKKTVPEIQL